MNDDWLQSADVSYSDVVSFIEMAKDTINFVNSAEIDFMQLPNGKTLKSDITTVCVEIICTGLNTINGIKDCEFKGE